MKKINQTILSKALEMFNKYGVSAVSIRQIATEIGISHSNLIYHYKTKQDIIEALHGELLQKAILLNEETKKNENFIAELLHSTLKGFSILFDYRFLMIDLNQIMRENENLRQIFLKVETARRAMYKETIEKAIETGYMREALYKDEYIDFIQHIKIFSDSWISSATIYDNKEKDEIIKKYANLFTKLFYPYLSEKGREEWKKL